MDKMKSLSAAIMYELENLVFFVSFDMRGKRLATISIKSANFSSNPTPI